ncbi:class II fructose-bisphosphatase [Salsipaludibacter albus]|uniref:class II fructose-bisphosphatase n=1 Tax=Salsipaludibacter albus TaxID=2849650 RepID=UPI001EE49961|nr:class II fructose-bisphosphatase [Salsipaludibacter albus]MBY5162575.1 class II fructose-bisphosphatase [Salsipaludibacter albus]
MSARSTTESPVPDPSRPDRNLALELIRVTEAAALASARWQGRGEKESGDQAAVDAMRKMLSSVDMDGTVIIGEGEKDEAPMLFNGERVGTGEAPEVDIAVDPVDGTRLLAEGRPGAIAVLAAAPRGTMFDPGPAVYMHKLVVNAEAADVVELDMPIPDLLQAVAKASGKRVGDLTVMMLDRDRHAEFKQQVRAAGARLNLIMDGDVAGGISAAWASRPSVDILYGIGGTPEGVTTACGVRALGGRILGRVWARNDDQRRALLDAGYDLDQVLDTDDLVSSPDCFLACTGITPSELLAGVTFDGHGAVTESLMMRGQSGTVRRVRASHRTDKVATYGG